MSASGDAAIAPAQAAPTDTAGARLLRLLSHENVSGPVRRLAELAACAIDGEWLSAPPTADAAGALARAVLAHETDAATLRASYDTARARAVGLEAQLLSLVGDGGGTVALREELDEARAGAAAASAVLGERFEAMWVEHAGALREEAATLRARIAVLETEAAELRDVVASTRRGAQGTAPTVRMGGGEPEGMGSLRQRVIYEDVEGARE